MLSENERKRVLPEAAAVWISNQQDIQGVLLGFDGITASQAVQRVPNSYRTKCTGEKNGTFRVLQQNILPTDRNIIGRFSGTCLSAGGSKHYEMLAVQDGSSTKVFLHSSDLAAKSTVVGVTDNLVSIFGY